MKPLKTLTIGDNVYAVPDKVTLDGNIMKFWKSLTAPETADTLLYSIDLSALVSGGTIDDSQIQAAVNNYLDANPVHAGATTEQAEQIRKNTEDISQLSEEIAKWTGTGLSTEAIDKLEEVGNYLAYTTTDGGSKWTELISILRNSSNGGGSDDDSGSDDSGDSGSGDSGDSGSGDTADYTLEDGSVTFASGDIVTVSGNTMTWDARNATDSGGSNYYLNVSSIADNTTDINSASNINNHEKIFRLNAGDVVNITVTLNSVFTASGVESVGRGCVITKVEMRTANGTSNVLATVNKDVNMIMGVSYTTGDITIASAADVGCIYLYGNSKMENGYIGTFTISMKINGMEVIV